MKRRPPIIPTRLLRHFGCSTQNDEIIGDLIEQYQRGQSHCWYWKETIIALIQGFMTEMRLHGPLIFRGLATAILLQNALHYAIEYADAILVPGRAWERPNALVGMIFLTALASAGSARLIARLHRPHHRSTLFVLIAWQFLPLMLPFRLFRSAIPRLLFTSWIGEFSYHIHVFYWNTAVLTALNEICSSCTTLRSYGMVLAIPSAILTVIAMLFGSGVLSDNTVGQTTRLRPVSE
jgi:hypothetical protein